MAKHTVPIIPERFASFTCGASKIAPPYMSSRFARERSRSLKIWWLIEARWIGLYRPEDSFPPAQVRHRKRTRSLYPNTMPILQWKRRLASVAVLVWQRVQMLPRCYLQAPKFRTSRSCRKAHQNVIVVFSAWFAQWTRKALAIAQTFTNASQSARRRFPEASWQRCI